MGLKGGSCDGGIRPSDLGGRVRPSAMGFCSFSPKAWWNRRVQGAMIS